MNKQCKYCGSNVSNEAKFCQECGGSDFLYNNQMPNQPSYNQAWQPPVPQNQPKKKNKGLIIGIVVLVLLVMAGIGMMLEKVFQMQGYGDNSRSNDGYDYNVEAAASYNFEETPEKLYYSKGTFDGSVYINKWADIVFELPEGYSDADLATYNAAENSNTECGMYFMADDTMGLIYICYEKLPSFPVYDEEKYLDAAMKTLANVSSVTYEIPDTYSTISIGGYTYAKAECSFNNGNGDFANTFYARKLDDYMITISVIGVDFSSNDALVNGITSVE